MMESKALQETWKQKQAVYEETKSMNKQEVIDYFNSKVDRFLNKTGFKKKDITKEGHYKISRK